MKRNIIIAGVGGQGVLTTAAVLAITALKQKLHVKQSELHGMSQRGGIVYTHISIATGPINSPLIPINQADLILGLEPMEAIRHSHYLKPGGWIISNTTPVITLQDYPDIEILKANIRKHTNHLLINADSLAKKCHASASVNMVMLGAASFFLELNEKKINETISFIFRKKNKETITRITNAYLKGKEEAEEVLPNSG